MTGAWSTKEKIGLACIALALIALGATEHQPRPVAAGLILLLIAAAWSLAGSAVALDTYRRRGSENVDEMQELSG